MDLLPSVDILRDHLLAHDRAVREIIALDEYIEELSEQTYIASMGECMHATFQKMIRISIAEGLKRMYKEYRLQKWLKVQEMAKTVRRVLEADLRPDEPPAQQRNDQLVPVQNFQSSPWQQQNMNFQMQVPDNVAWQPENLLQQVVSPVYMPLPQVISPIQTPTRTDNALISRRPAIEASPDDFHQFSMGNISASENPLTSRQLFDESSEIISSDCDNSSANNIGNGDIVLENVLEEPVQNATNAIVVQNSSSVIAQQSVNFGNTFENQSVIPPTMHQQQFPVPNEHLENSDEEMDWDDDDSSYDESEDSLAGVLFAAEHLLPDEQAVRLDVEMGDMGVGHMVFDRVSATWYTSQCEFYRFD